MGVMRLSWKLNCRGFQTFWFSRHNDTLTGKKEIRYKKNSMTKKCQNGFMILPMPNLAYFAMKHKHKL